MIQRIITAAITFFVCYSSVYGQSVYADSLQQIIALNKHDEAERRAYSLLANHYFKSNPAKAKTYMLQLVKAAFEADDYLRQSSAFALLLTIYQDEGNIDSAVYCVNMLKSVAEKAPDNYKVLGNYNQAVGLYYKKRSDFKTALPYSLEAVKYAEKSGPDKPYLGGQWLNAGDVYLGLGDYRMAMDCNLKALNLFEESGSKRGEAFCYTNMSALYNLLKQYGNALKSAQKSLELKKQLNDNRGVCTAMQEIGEAYMGMKKMPQAFSNYESALKIAIAEKLPLEEATCYFTMAKIYAAQDKDSLAIAYFKKTRTIATELDNKLIAANADIELAALYKNADSLKHAEETLFTSLQTFKEAGSLEKESDNYKRLSDLYANNKQYDKALAYNNKYHAIKDSIAGINIQVQLKNLEEQYNSVKKEKEITLLKIDGELKQQQLQQQRFLMLGSAILALLALGGIVLLINRNKLRQQMKELELRNRIAANLHDEVGSSLSSIHMLSQMATRDVNETAQKDILARMSSNAKETMDKMGDIVWMIKPNETEAGTLKQRMERFACEICETKNIELEMHLDELDKTKLTMDQRRNIYLVFKEAINNAVKYSGTKKIKINTILQSRELILEVKDLGRGFDWKIVKKGNGLDNMQSRAKELSGSLFFDSLANEGTIVKLSLPV